MQWQVVQAQIFHRRVQSRYRYAELRREWFTAISFQNSAIRAEILMRQNTIFGILNLVHGMAFQRTTNRWSMRRAAKSWVCLSTFLIAFRWRQHHRPAPLHSGERQHRNDLTFCGA